MAEMKTVTEYVHGGPEASDEFSPLWDADAPQQKVFHYCLYEESVKIEVNMDTGQFRYLAFAGVDLSEPTKWFG